MASIRKRTWKSGGEIKTAWIADYLDQAGERHIKTFRTKKEADAYLVETRHEVKEGTHTAASASISVGDAADLWLKTALLNGLERSTVKQYENHVRHHIKPLLGNRKLSDLSTPNVQAFATDLIGRPFADDPTKTLSRAMAKKVLSSLKGIIKEAQVQGKVARNAASPVTIKVPTRGAIKIKAGRDFPTKAEINAMLSKAAGRWRPLILTAIFTGLRSSELRGLRWEDVDFAARTIHIHQRADAWGVMGPPKTEAGERTIPLVPMLEKALKEWKLQCPRKKEAGGGEGALWLVFPNGDGNPESHANIVNRGFAPLQVACAIADPVKDAAGQVKADKKGAPILGARYGFHTLRHFFASWVIEQEFPPKKVQGLLGHSSMQMTYDTYGHLFPNLEDDHAKLAAGELALVG